ncbi:MAG: hypothetical protein E6Y83_01195 [Clostridium butyricum]|nr:hypothetical protein [Clostridium butyricum]
MSNLKAKLAQKLELEDTNKNDINSIISENIKEDNNLIVIKPEDRVEFSYVPEFAITMNEARERINMLQSFVKEMMIPKIDYGFIPNCDKPSLFKSGAEKLCDTFGFSKQIEILNRVEDWDKGLFHYEVKTILKNKRTGIIEAEGIGSCNTKERKYIKQDSYSIINTILKMAKKRAFVDAVLSATRSSGIFTQDIEELDDENFIIASKKARIKKTTKTTINKSKEIMIKAITKAQQTQIILTLNKNKIPIEYAKELMQERYKVDESKKLTTEQADEFIDLLKCSSII